jgi:4-hydroxy-4-methyl-2-oxoglutarate aldolase
MKLCGPAVTVSARPGDNLIIHKAIYTAQPGDVLVVDTKGFVEAGIWGSLMTEAAMQSGLAGLVTDGAVRDADEIIEAGFPVFARGLCIKGTTKCSLGWINHPVTLGGVHIRPGDLVAGDRDGVVAVRCRDLPGVIEKARQREAKEKEIATQLKGGTRFLDLTGFQEKLVDLGLTEA